MLAPDLAVAQDFTAGIVITQMPEGERYPFLLGVVEGLSYGRYVQDEKQNEGMQCIWEWFLREGTTSKIYEAFAAFPDHAPAAVVRAMYAKECGA